MMIQAYTKAQRLFYHKWIIVAGLFLIFSEASWWFIFPDLFIFIYTITVPKNYFKVWLVALITSTLGTISYWYLVQNAPELTYQILQQTVGITPEMLAYVEDTLPGIEALSLLTQSMSGVPVKVWTWFAAVGSLSLPEFVLPTVASRGLRMLMTLAIAWAVNRFFGDVIKKHYVFVLSITLITFLVGWQIVVYTAGG